VIDITPAPIALQLGPVAVHWYGIAYAVGLAAAYLIMVREARRRGEDTRDLVNGMILVAVAALIGGRLYHVIDQWANYQDHLAQIVLPPYTGLGVYGGIATGLVAMIAYTRWKSVRFWTWADIAAPALLVMQAVARWGNFFNQELYGPPTDLPWGVAIQCANRIPAYACPPGADPAATLGQHFQPLFLYESISGAVGALVLLWAARRFATMLRPGDLALVFFVWYASTRFALETLRTDNWTFFGVPMAMIMSAGVIVAALSVLLLRHRRRQPGGLDPPPAEPAIT
jgi:phosphatidylglycerol:prolipoprotein diacylglycerol transferase